MCKEYMYENRVFINDTYVTFNIITIDRTNGTISVNINDSGHHTIDTFELKDLDGWTYFEYGRPIPEKIYVEDFKEINVLIHNSLRYNHCKLVFLGKCLLFMVKIDCNSTNI